MSTEYDLTGVKVKFLPASQGPDIKTKQAGANPMWGCNAEFIDETGQTKKHSIWCWDEIKPDMIGKTWTGSFVLYNGTFTDQKTGQTKSYISRTFYPDKDVAPQEPMQKAEEATVNQETRGSEHPMDVYKNALRRHTNFLWSVCKGTDQAPRSDEAAAAIFPGVRMMCGDYTPLFDLFLKDAQSDDEGVPPSSDIPF